MFQQGAATQAVQVVRPGATTQLGQFCVSPVILYLHGFRSAPQSVKARQLKAFLAQHGLAHSFVCPALSFEPEQAMRDVEATYGTCKPDQVTLIGSSLGGHYATYLAEKYGWRAILVNPAVGAHRTLQPYIGEQTNLYTGEVFTFTLQHLEFLSRIFPQRITQPARYWLMVETGDELLDYRCAVDYYAGAKQTIITGGDHSFQAWEKFLPEVMPFSRLSSKLT